MCESSDVSEIIPGFLYLGGRSALHNITEEMNVGFILNITERANPDQNPDHTQLFIKAQDVPYINISKHFSSAHDFILKAKEENKAVFVHCEMGISRSATIVLSYLISQEKMTLKEAFQHTKKKRPIVMPNSGFLEHLIAHEKKIHGKSTLSLGNWGKLNWTVEEVSPNTVPGHTTCSTSSDSSSTKEEEKAVVVDIIKTN